MNTGEVKHRSKVHWETPPLRYNNEEGPAKVTERTVSETGREQNPRGVESGEPGKGISRRRVMGYVQC